MAARTLTQQSKEKLAELIVKKRHEKSITQEELARRVEVSLATVAKWEQRQAAPTTRSAKKALKRELGINVEGMIEEGELQLTNGKPRKVGKRKGKT